VAGVRKGGVSRKGKNPQRLYEMFLDIGIFSAGCVAEEGLRHGFCWNHFQIC